MVIGFCPLASQDKCEQSIQPIVTRSPNPFFILQDARAEAYESEWLYVPEFDPDMLTFSAKSTR